MKKLLLTLVLSVFLMTSCANQPSLADDTRKIEDSATTNSATSSPESLEVTTATEDAAAPESTVVTSGELTVEDIGKLYPDKTVLTISCSTYIHRPEMIRNANEYLSSIGKEYVIYLCPVEAESVKIGDIGRLGSGGKRVAFAAGRVYNRFKAELVYSRKAVERSED